MLSEYNDYGWGKRFESNKIYQADELKRELLWNDASLKGALKDVYKLWKNNRDDPHTNFYYTLLRIWHIGFDSIDLRDIFNRGISLNFVFFTIGFFVAYLIARRLFTQEWLILVFLGVAFLNPASISNTMFMRPYALQEMCFLLFCYGFIVACEALRENYWQYNVQKNRFIFAFCSAMLLSSGYFGVVFVLMIIGIASLWEQICCKPVKKLSSFFPLSFLYAIALCFLFYPKYSRGFRGGRSVEASDKISLDYLREYGLDNLSCFFDIVGSNISYVLLIYIAVCLLLSIWYAKRLSYREYIALLFGLCAFVWAFAVIYIAPYKTLRYIMAIFPLMLLLLPFSLRICDYAIRDIMASFTAKRVSPTSPLQDGVSCGGTSKRNAIGFIKVALCVICFYIVVPKQDSKIEFLDHGILKVHSNERASKAQSVLYLNSMYLYANILPYIKDEVLFIESCAGIFDMVEKYGAIELIQDDIDCDMSGYKTQKLWNAGGMQGLLLERL